MNLRQEIRNSEEHRYKKTFTESAISLASKAAVGYGVAKIAGHIPTGIAPEKLRFVDKFTIGGKAWYDPSLNIKRAGQSATVKELIWNATKAAEEQLFKIPRTFSLSSVIGGGILSKGEFKVEGDILEKNLDFLRRISENKINKKVAGKGLYFKGGQLFSIGDASKGDFTKPLLKRASLYPGEWASDIYSGGKKVGYTSRFVEGLQSQFGIKASRTDAFFSGGQSRLKALRTQLGGIILPPTENYMRLLDNPFEMFSEFLDKTIGASGRLGNATNWASKNIWEKFLLKDQFGVGGSSFLKDTSALGLLKRHALRGLPKLAMLGAAVGGVNWLLRSTPIIKDTPLGTGIKGVAASGYQAATKTGALVSDVTGMTAYSKWQDKNAPGSTSLMGLAAFPLSLSIAGGTIGGIANLAKQVPIGQKPLAPKLFSRMSEFLDAKPGIVGKVSKGLKLSELGRVGSFAAIGAAVGLAGILPFIPGAVGSSKSRDELSRIYDNQELVPIRKGRYWEFGTSPFKGSEIDHFAPHWSVRAKTDASMKGKMPEEYYSHPLRYAIDKLLDPYALEKKLDKERPYTYWGSTDHGLGFMERVLWPIKEAFKPTVLAHPESSGSISPGMKMSKGLSVPESLRGTTDAVGTGGYFPEIESPDSLGFRLSQIADSIVDVAGIHGFAAKGLMDSLSGGQSPLTPNAIYEQSGRIMSSQRSFWDNSIGGAGGMSEAYRRLNPARQYATEYVSAPIRNTMPSWIPEGKLRYGDPFSQIPQGELRLPGRGYAALHPELKDVNYEDYPLVHRLNILNSVAPNSSEFYSTEAMVSRQVSEGQLNEGGENLYNDVERQRELIKNDNSFDNSDNIIGKYYLALKKMGRSLPTEALYPFSPIHKFSGPVDVVSQYKSSQLLDKDFKSWEHPVSDYLMPAVRRTVDSLSLVDYVPNSNKEDSGIESYFLGLQNAKNQVLEQKASAAENAGDYQSASFYRKGWRPTIVGQDPSGDLDNLTRLLPQRYSKFMNAFASSDKRDKILRMVPSEVSQVLSAQWKKKDYMMTSDYDKLSTLRNNLSKVHLENDVTAGDTAPDKNWIGYAPGVNLNAFKVKTISNMGKNIRDFGLWREDERNAQILDTHLRSANISGSQLPDMPGFDREVSKRALEEYLSSIGMRGAKVFASPTIGSTSVDLQVGKDSSSEIRDNMQDNGWITG